MKTWIAILPAGLNGLIMDSALGIVEAKDEQSAKLAAYKKFGMICQVEQWDF